MPNFPIRTQRKVATRAKLLTAARALFLAHGYEAVTVRDVAHLAGYSTGAIFASWKGKDELFAEAMGRPHLTDGRGAELLAHLKAISPGAADELLSRWAA